MERKKKQVEAEAGHGTSDIQHKITDKELAKKIEENQSMFSRRLQKSKIKELEQKIRISTNFTDKKKL